MARINDEVITLHWLSRDQNQGKDRRGAGQHKNLEAGSEDLS